MRLPTDLWCLIFQALPLRDLLRCACVCKTWSSICNRDQFWLQALAKRIGSAKKPAKLDYVPGSLGVLSIRVLYQFACVGSRNCQDEFDLAWFKGFPYHPVRHRTPTPLNLLRLARCIVTRPEGFLCLAGEAPKLRYKASKVGWDWQAENSVQHRSARYGSSLDLSVRILYWVALIFLAVVTAATHSSYADFLFGILYVKPLCLAVRAVPLATCFGFSRLLFYKRHEGVGFLFFWLCVAVYCYETYPEVIFEYPISRIIFLVACCVIGERRTAGALATGPPRVYVTRTHGLTGLVIGGGVALWRVALPVAFLGLAMMLSSLCIDRIANLGFSAWRNNAQARPVRRKH